MYRIKIYFSASFWREFLDWFLSLPDQALEQLELHNMIRLTCFSKEACQAMKEEFNLSYKDLTDYYLTFGKLPKKSQLILIRHFGVDYMFNEFK